MPKWDVSRLVERGKPKRFGGSGRQRPNMHNGDGMLSACQAHNPARSPPAALPDVRFFDENTQATTPNRPQQPSTPPMAISNLPARPWPSTTVHKKNHPPDPSVRLPTRLPGLPLSCCLSYMSTCMPAFINTCHMCMLRVTAFCSWSTVRHQSHRTHRVSSAAKCRRRRRACYWTH